MHAAARRQRACLRREQAHPRVELRRRRVDVRVQHPVAPFDRLLREPRADDVERDPLPRLGLAFGPVLGVQPAHPQIEAGRRQHEPVAGPDRARDQGAGHDHPRARQREGAIDREARIPRAVAAARTELRQRLPERLDPRPCACGNRQDRRVAQGRGRQQRPDLRRDRRDPAGREVRLRDRDYPAPNAEQVEDRRVLAGLGHHPVIGRDDEQGRVDAARPGQHRMHEPLVPRHVHEAECVRIGVAEIDRDAAPFLLFQPVRVDAGQRAHEGRLAVVDMARRPDDHAATLPRPAPPGHSRPIAARRGIAAGPGLD